MTPPAVTVLMTVYNDAQFVSEAIHSILIQTLENFEFLIVDDGSTDDTPDILAAAQRADPRVRVHRQENAGTTAAANAGLSLARAPLIARLDSDDISLPYRLEVELTYLTTHRRVALVGGGAQLIDTEGNVVGTRNVLPHCPKLALLSRCIFQQSDVMFRRDIALAVGGYRAKFRNSQDYDLWLRISEVADIAKLPVILGKWRVNPGGYTLARPIEQRYEFAMARKFARERRRTGMDSYRQMQPYAHQTHRRRIDAHKYNVWLAGSLLRDGRPREARSYARKAQHGAITLRAATIIAASHLPGRLLQFLVACRDTYLNYRYALFG